MVPDRTRKYALDVGRQNCPWEIVIRAGTIAPGEPISIPPSITIADRIPLIFPPGRAATSPVTYCAVRYKYLHLAHFCDKIFTP
jgi:hypothetical protein